MKFHLIAAFRPFNFSIVRAVLPCIALFAATASNAQIIAWDVTGTNSSTSLAATTVNSNLQTGGSLNALTRNGVTWNTTANAFASTNWTIAASLDMSTANSISFTVAPVAGFTLTLTDLQFAMWGSNTAPKNGVWAYKIDGGSYSTLGTKTLTNSASGLTTLSFAPNTTVTSDQTVTVSFFAYGTGTTGSVGGSSAAATTGAIRVGNLATFGNDLVLNGTLTASPVPEPSTYAAIFGALALAGVMIHRRRRAT